MSLTKEKEIDIYVSDLGRAIVFYEELLEVKIEKRFDDRWAFFPDSKLFLLSYTYDNKNNIPKTSHQATRKPGNSCIPVFHTSDINNEHSRIELLSHNVSEICFLNVIKPYYFFTFMDPDGNILEIGNYPKLTA